MFLHLSIYFSDVYYRPGTMLCTSHKDEQDKILDLENLKSSARGKYKKIHYMAISVTRDMTEVLWESC